MEPVQIVGRVFFPLDEELGLRPGSLTPKHQDHLAHLSTWMPFGRACQMLETLLGIQISEPTARRGTERAGTLLEARQITQSQQPAAPSTEVTPCEKQVVSTDGCYVPLVKGQWAEVRTVAIGEIQQKTGKTCREPQTQHLSYFSRMMDAETFEQRAEVEMRRRGVSQAKAVCAVTDGADWIQGFIDLHRFDALRVLDFPHAAEHLGDLMQALQQAGVVLPQGAFERCLHILKHRGPSLLLRWCDRLPCEVTQQEDVSKPLNYFRKRVALMQYPTYRQLGWPIGSGMVESANKVVVQARLKGAGMRWGPTHVNPMLTLRTAVCSERWDEGWQDLLAEHQTQRAQARQLRVSARFEATLSSLLLLLLRFRPPTPIPTPQPTLPPVPCPVEPAATLPGSSRPSAHHPWKKGPACRPKLFAKK